MSLYGFDDDTQTKALGSMADSAKKAWNYQGGSVFQPQKAATQAQAPGSRAQPASTPQLSLSPTGGYGAPNSGGGGLGLTGFTGGASLGTNIPNPVRDQFDRWTGASPNSGKTSDPTTTNVNAAGGVASAGVKKAIGDAGDHLAARDPFTALANRVGNWNSNQASIDYLNEIIASAGNQQTATTGILNRLATDEREYLGQMDDYTKGYMGYLDEREKSARAQNAQTGGYLDQLMRGMGTDYANSGQYKGQAIDWNDPNNAIARDTRQLYEDQAQGARKQGLADVGVLSALGSQAMGSQIAGQPMTGGQLQAMSGGVQNRAQEAYRIAQQRMQDLRDQGLEQGFARSDAAYGRHADARDAFMNATGQDYQIRKDMGDTLTGIGGERLGVNSQLATLRNQIRTGQAERGLAAENQYYGTLQSALAGKAELAEALRTGNMDMLKEILSKSITAIPEYMKAGAEVAKVPAAYIPFAGG